MKFNITPALRNLKKKKIHLQKCLKSLFYTPEMARVVHFSSDGVFSDGGFDNSYHHFLLAPVNSGNFCSPQSTLGVRKQTNIIAGPGKDHTPSSYVLDH